MTKNVAKTQLMNTNFANLYPQCAAQTPSLQGEGQQFKRVKLKWRASRGPRRSLGRIPFKESAISYRQGHLWYCGQPISLWDSYGLADYELGSGSFSEDARGRWYLNVTVKVPTQPINRVPIAAAAVGIDLGQKP